MPCFARQFVSIVLAAIFVVVGGTGEALYYLVEADSGRPAQAQEQQHAAYFHQHGDGLWHHHGVTQSRAFVATTSSDKSQGFDGQLAIHKPSPGHQSHSCFVLAIVSQLQQSLTNGTTTFVADTHVAASYEVAECRHTHLFLPTQGARGPPLLVTI